VCGSVEGLQGLSAIREGVGPKIQSQKRRRRMYHVGLGHLLDDIICVD
jgi:hypothetical protein